MHWSSAYVGLPFEDGGRGPEAFDCWGVVVSVYRAELGIELPTYGEISARDLMRVTRAMQAGQEAECWRPVNDPREFDVVVMRLTTRSFPGHVGVMVDAKNMLHIEAASQAVIVPLNHVLIRSRVIGIRRYQHK